MTIDKLSPEIMVIKPEDHSVLDKTVYNQILIFNKINELVDEINSINRVHQYHMENVVDTMSEHRERIEKLENKKVEEHTILLPCPHCNCPAIHISQSAPLDIYGECARCGARGPIGATQESATKEWNKRA